MESKGFAVAAKHTSRVEWSAAVAARSSTAEELTATVVARSAPTVVRSAAVVAEHTTDAERNTTVEVERVTVAADSAAGGETKKSLLFYLISLKILANRINLVFPGFQSLLFIRAFQSTTE